MARGNKPAIGRINPDTGELEFQGANKMWIPSGVRFEKSVTVPVTKIGQSSAPNVPLVVKTCPVKVELTEEEKMQQAMMDLCARRGACE